MAQLQNCVGVVGSWHNSVSELVTRLPPPDRAFVTVKAYRFTRQTSGTLYDHNVTAHGPFTLTPWGEVVKPQERKNMRPGKIDPSWKTQPAEIVLESLFAGPDAPGGAFDRAPDEAVWAAGLRFCNEQNLQGQAALTLARALLSVLVVRAGAAQLTEYP